MKANLIRRIAIAICLLSCISIYSCKKENSGSGTTTESNVGTASDDQSQVSTESDIVTTDANTALSGQSSFSGSFSSSAEGNGTVELNSVDAGAQIGSLVNIHNLICDATITYDTVNTNRVITIVYDGTNCWGNRTRSGTVTISLPLGQHWKDAGATATINVESLKITRLRDGKSITLNGTKTITNVSGGLLKDLSSLQTITHTITGDLVATFDNGSQRTWNVSKMRVFTYNNGIVITTTGTHSDGTNSNIAE